MTVELGGDEKEVSKCINCDGLGSLTCTTCQGSGIQPRYLDRRYERFLKFSTTKLFKQYEFDGHISKYSKGIGLLYFSILSGHCLWAGLIGMIMMRISKYSKVFFKM